MKHYNSFGHRLPHPLSARLFGDRKQFGTTVVPDEPCWKEWSEEVYQAFYQNTQKQSVGKNVNDAGYRVLEHLDLTGMSVLEVGP